MAEAKADTPAQGFKVAAVVPPELVVEKDNMEDERKIKQVIAQPVKTKKTARRPKKWVGNRVNTMSPARTPGAGVENAGVNGTPVVATPPVVRRRPRRALRPRGKLR